MLLGKLHESFVGLSAQLHVVHEAVKVNLLLVFLFLNQFTINFYRKASSHLSI